MIRFRCKECGKKLKADEEIIGRMVRCTRCDSVETVPDCDNLAKPNQPKSRLLTNKPHSNQPKSTPLFGNSNTVNLDEPIELFGHSSAGSPPTEHFEPRFNIVTRKPSRLRRWILLGAIGVFAVAAIAVVLNLGWILDSRRRLSTDYQNLDEVVYYRNAAAKLEKSRRMMYVAGKIYIATKLVNEDEIKELEDFNASIESLTTESDIYSKVETLFRSGKDVQAKALLVNTAVELDQRRKEVEKRTREYSKMANAP